MKKITVVKNRPPANLPNVKTYAALRARVKQILVLGRQKIDEINLSMYWETGRSIRTHILQNGDRAAYGEQVVLNLSRDLEVSDETLYKAKRFYEAYPISTPAWKLTVRHYLALARISDEKKRIQLAVKAEKEGWITDKLETEVRSVVRSRSKAGSNGKAVSKPKFLKPKKGKVGIFQIIENKGRLSIDLGFTSYLELGAKLENLKSGDFVRFKANDRIEKTKGAAAGDLFTYKAELERVIDADTVWMKIWLKGPLWLREKLRLRGLDAPELDTAAGQTAKRFVESFFKKAVSITIATTKPDKWDRYLSDVFLKMEDGKEVFLNNLLLEKGFAVRKDKFSLLDWGK